MGKEDLIRSLHCAAEEAFYQTKAKVEAAFLKNGIGESSLRELLLWVTHLGYLHANVVIKIWALNQGETTLAASQIAEVVEEVLRDDLPQLIEGPLGAYLKALRRLGVEKPDESKTRQLLTVYARKGAAIAVAYWQLFWSLVQEEGS